MANQEHVALLQKGVDTWNQWRIENTGLANLAGANLAGANLAGANLGGADLTEAKLWGVNLAEANLAEATLEPVGVRRNTIGAPTKHSTV